MAEIGQTEFLALARLFNQEELQFDARKAALWRIENLTEEYLEKNIRVWNDFGQKSYEKDLKSLPIEEQNRFFELNNDIKPIQSLCFRLLALKTDKTPKKRRKRDVYGSPEYTAHRAFMKDYMAAKKAKSKEQNGG